MAKPVGIAAIQSGEVIVVCDDGTAYIFDGMGLRTWTELPPVPETMAAHLKK